MSKNAAEGTATRPLGRHLRKSQAWYPHRIMQEAETIKIVSDRHECVWFLL